MNPRSIHLLMALVRGETAVQVRWLMEKSPRALVLLGGSITVGCGVYGFAIGLGRAPLMACYVAVKMPLLIFLTLAVNGLVNGMFGSLLGSGMSFRQTLQACLMSFAVFAMIVASLAPLMIAMALDRPADGEPGLGQWYRGFLLLNTAAIAFAGMVANHKLLRLIAAFSGSLAAAWRTLAAWLAGNLFVGAQLSYNLRPFFGNPRQGVEFLRPDPFGGTFYEAVWKMTSTSGLVVFAIMGGFAWLGFRILKKLIALVSQPTPQPPLAP